MVPELTASLSVTKALNNNVVLARDSRGAECVLIGRGIGFAPAQSPLSSQDPRIEKRFVLVGEGSARFLHLLEMLDMSLVGACEEIISLASRQLGQELSASLHIALPEHLAFALHRLRLGVELPNPFLAQTETLYPAEFAIAGEAVSLLAERTGVLLPAAERGFLALHLVAGRQHRTAACVTRQLRQTP